MKNLSGLNDKQVLKNREKYGANVIPQPKLKNAFQFFFEMFDDKINLILIFLLFVCILLAITGYGSIYEPIGIGTVLIIVGILETVTKLKSQKYTTELKNKINIHFCNVIRNNNIKHINTQDVVFDDLVLLETGETICADGYLVSGTITVNNAVLNGENTEIEKIPVQKKYTFTKTDDSNKYIDKHSVFAATTVQSGFGIMRVTNVGLNTENAKTLLIMRSVTETKTSLNMQLDKLAEKINKIGYIGAIIIFILLLSSNIFHTGMEYFFNPWQSILKDVITYLTIAISVIVAAVPEGLPIIIEIITAQNTRTLIKHNILAKNPYKIPEAGNIQILCTDKTGTLTYGNLIPIKNYLGDGSEMPFDSESMTNKLFLQNIILNNSANYDSNGEIVGGNNTDRALLSISNNKNKAQKIISQVTVIEKKQFNSTDKFSAVQIIEHKNNLTYYKGAPEIILEKCTFYLDKNGKVQKINKQKITKLLSKFTSDAMRVIATAYQTDTIKEKIPNNLILISLTCIRDEIRTEVPNAVQSMYNAGIQTIMITGDNQETANAIATDCGILKQTDISMTATDISNLSDSELKKILHKIKVIARATPETKLRIVDIAQQKHLCIGMCGDGTNDAPALRKADVGFAMGSGTDVCKEAGDIIITDDNFISITQAILFGRTFTHNIENFLKFQLPINFSLLLACIFIPLFFHMDAFTAIQILIINIVMDSLNSMAFGNEKPKDVYLTESPHKKGEPLINKPMKSEIIINTVLFSVMILLTFLPPIQKIFNNAPNILMSARFAILILVAMLNGFNIREKSTKLTRDITKNPTFIYISILVWCGTFFIIQFGQNLLQTTPLSPIQWTSVIIISSMIIPLDIIRKKYTQQTGC